MKDAPYIGARADPDQKKLSVIQEDEMTNQWPLIQGEKNDNEIKY